MNLRERVRRFLCFRFQLLPIERYRDKTREQEEMIDALREYVVDRVIRSCAERLEDAAFISTLRGITSPGRTEAFIVLKEAAKTFRDPNFDRNLATDRLLCLLDNYTVMTCDVPAEEAAIQQKFRDEWAKGLVRAGER